jgi:hypothetical protein
MRQLAYISFSIILLANLAYAYEPNKITSIYGVGSVSCEDFVQARHENNTTRIGKYKQWVYGYFTAVSMYYPPANNKRFLDSTNSNDALTWIEHYCRKDPAGNLHDAVKSLQNELLPVHKENRKKTQGPIPPAKETTE